MVIDSSALLAILLDEPERTQLSRAIEADPVRLIAAPTLLEAAIALTGKKGEAALPALDLVIAAIRADIIPFGDDEQRIARRAFLTYGKGRHPAALTYGDCMAYALSVTRSEPLLFKGVDFSQTDVAACGWEGPL